MLFAVYFTARGGTQFQEMHNGHGRGIEAQSGTTGSLSAVHSSLLPNCHHVFVPGPLNNELLLVTVIFAMY